MAKAARAARTVRTAHAAHRARSARSAKRARTTGDPAPGRGAAAPCDCVCTASDSLSATPIFGRRLDGWREEILRLLATVRVNRRVDAARLAALEVHFADAREMATLNFRHLQHRGATDVLTFPMDDLASAPTAPAKPGARPGAQGSTARAAAVSGVVIVCPAVAAREAKARKLAPAEELLRYILHGALHLLGENDKTPAQRKRMHAIQEKLLGAWFAAAAKPAERPVKRTR